MFSRLPPDQLGIEASGRVDFDRDELAVSAALDAPDLGAFDRIAKTALAGEAGLTLDIDGAIMEPAGTARLRGSGLLIDSITLADLDTTLDFEATHPLDQDRAGFRLGSKGEALGIIVPETTLPDEAVDWTADLLLPLEGMITIEQASIETAGATLAATGSIEPETLRSDLDLKLDIETLHRLVAPYGEAIDGRARIEAKVTTGDRADAIAVDLDATLSELANLPDGAAELLGESADLDATVALDQRRHLRIEALSLKGREASLQGKVGLDLESRDLSSAITATLPRLAALADLIGEPIEGALALDAAIAGTLDDPRAELTLTSDRLTLGDEQLDAIALNLRGNNLSASPEGALKLDVTARTLPLTLALTYQLDDSSLTLQQTRLEGPSTQLGGDLTIDLERTLIDGTLNGGIDDLSALAPLLQETLAGAVTFEAALAPDDTAQKADLSVRGERIGGDFGTIRKIELDAALSDMLGKAGIEATARLQGFDKDDVALSTGTARVAGDLDRLAIDLALDGKAMQPLSLETNADLTLGDGITLDVGRLSGRFAGEELRLNLPLKVEQSDLRLAVNDLDLSLGAARLSGGVEIGEQQAEGTLALRSLPLAWLERFDGPPLEGLVRADIGISGSIDRPQVSADIDFTDIRADKVTKTDLPPMDVTYRARLENGYLASSLLAARLTRQPIEATAAHPLNLTLRPFSLEAPEDGVIEGKADLAVSLERLGDLLALDGQVMKGDLTADLTFGGTIGEPRIDGPITLDNGQYEYLESGTALNEIVLGARAANQMITVDRLTAKTGNGGTVDGEGWIDLHPDENFPLSLSLAFKNAELVSRDDVEATISGDLAMLGNLDAASVEGNLAVNRADLSIPEGGGIDLPDIDVEEIGATIVNIKKPEKNREKAFDPRLDIAVALPNKVYVRGRGLDSEWQGDLNITGPASAPRVTGDLEVKKGYFDFIEKRFQIEKRPDRFQGRLTAQPAPGHRSRRHRWRFQGHHQGQRPRQKSEASPGKRARASRGRGPGQAVVQPGTQ